MVVGAEMIEYDVGVDGSRAVLLDRSRTPDQEQRFQ